VKRNTAKGFTRCSDCNIELVDHLPAHAAASKGLDDGEYVVVATVQGQFQDGQICSFLEANGIPARVECETFRKVYGLGMESVQILVPQRLAATARHLLRQAEGGKLMIDTGDNET